MALAFLLGCGQKTERSHGANEPARPPIAAPAGPVASAADTAWRAGIKKRILAGQYRIEVQGQTLSAWNPKQRLRASWTRTLEVRGSGSDADRPALALGAVRLGRGGSTASLARSEFSLGACPTNAEIDERGTCLPRAERATGGLLEWWENRPDGLAHGFVVKDRPASKRRGDWLRIEVKIGGARVASLGDGSSRAELETSGGERYLYAGLEAWDANKTPLTTRMLRGPQGGLWLDVDDAGAVYPITVDPVLTAAGWTVEQNQDAYWAPSVGLGSYLKAAGTGDVNGDGYDDVLVAFPYYNGGTGRVHLFYGGASGPDLVADWTSDGSPPPAGSTSAYGIPTSTASDVNGDGYADAVIGESGFNNRAGRVLIFHGSAAGLPSQPNTSLVGDQAGANFPYCMDSAGDFNADGFSDLVVSSVDHDSNGLTNNGLVRVFLGGPQGITTTPSDVFHGTGPDMGLGRSCSIAGDVNGDGRDDLAIGYTTAAEEYRGKALVYLSKGDGTFDRATVWSAAGAAPGFSMLTVEGVGDMNGDGYGDLAVAGIGADVGAANTNEGRVSFFLGSPSGLTGPVASIDGSYPGAGLGNALARLGDANGDGYADLMVAAFGHKSPSGVTGVGMTMLVLGSPDGPIPTGTAAPESIFYGEQQSDWFGSDISAAGDVNGDGLADFLASATGVDNGNLNEGRSYLYRGAAQLTDDVTGSQWQSESNIANAALGATVSSTGDINGDGYADLAIGAPNYFGVNSGNVFVYHGGPGGLVAGQAPNWSLAAPSAVQGFGKAVALVGDMNGDGFGELVVGAPDADSPDTDEGKIFIYAGSASGIPAGAVPWSLEGNSPGARLGSSVAAADVTGDGLADVVAGAPGYSNGQAAEGRLALVRGASSGIGAATPIYFESNAVNANLGFSIARAGDVNRDGREDVVVGSPGFTNGQSGEGRISVYRGVAGGLNTTPWHFEGNAVGVALGTAVGGAGDVDGDGFADVIAGAPKLTNGSSEEGRIYVLRGAATQAAFITAPWAFESDTAGARLGSAVASAGDLNGDGLGDIVAGAPGYSGRGRAYVFHALGNAAGLPAVPNATIEAAAAGWQMGSAVAGIGDLNGDGLSDLVLGAPGYGNGESAEGRVIVKLANGQGRSVRLRAQSPGGAATVGAGAAVTGPGTAYQIALRASSIAGRTGVKVEVETKPVGTAFNGAATVVDSSFTSVAGTGADLVRLVSGLSANTGYHYRARLLYSPTSSPYQKRSRWYYGGVLGEAGGVHFRTGASFCQQAGIEDGTPCDDGDLCTIGDTCSAGQCMAGLPKTCSDDNQCGQSTCAPSTGQCQGALVCELQGECAVAADGQQCGTGTSCTSCAIRPLAGCVVPVGATGFQAVFQYSNESGKNLRFPTGPVNRLVSASGGRPPDWFAAGPNAFSVASSGADVAWTIGAETVTLRRGSAQCPTQTGPYGDRVVLWGQSLPLLPDRDRVLASSVVATDSDGASTPQTPGKADGQFTVTSDGNASYEVPLWVPPGLGVQPQLALSYSSSNTTGSGPLGVGWSLSGLSSIQRCVKTIARDGEAAPITFTDKDALCLDGQRLVPVNFDGAGRPTHYRTQVDTFSKVYVLSWGASGPNVLLVYRKDGRILTYGGTADSRQTVLGDKVLAWGLSRLEDRTGNYLTVKYLATQETSNDHIGAGLEWLPEEISYGGNDTTDRPVSRSVRFVYTTLLLNGEERRDKTFRYVAGAKLESTKLLKRIELRAPHQSSTQELLRWYDLTYVPNGELTNLIGIRECERNAVCKQATQFDWTGDINEYEEHTTTITDPFPPGGVENYMVLHPADLDGDGKDDILYRTLRNSTGDHPPALVFPVVHEDWRYRLSNGATFDSAVDVGERDDGQPNLFVGAQFPDRGFYSKWSFGVAIDLNRDGRSDFATVKGKTTEGGLTINPHWRIFASGVVKPGQPSIGPQWRWMETDSDGNQLIEPNGELAEFLRTNPDSGADPNSSVPGRLYALDLNGDGFPEIVRPLGWEQPGGPHQWAYRPNNGGTLGRYKVLTADFVASGVDVPLGPLTAIGTASHYAVDLDGDGKTEMLFWPKVGATTLAALHLDKDGKGHISSTIFDGASGKRSWFADVNGDGLADAITVTGKGGAPQAQVSTGAKTFANASDTVEGERPYAYAPDEMGYADNIAPPFYEFGTQTREHGARVADVNQDGRADLVLTDDNYYRQNTQNLGLRKRVVALVSKRELRPIVDGSGNTIGQRGTLEFQPLALRVTRRNGSAIPAEDVPLGAHTGNGDSSVIGIRNVGFRLSQILDVNGDGLADLVQMKPGGSLSVYRKLGPKAHMIYRITDGMGAKTHVTYKPISDSSVHTPSPQCSYPLYCERRGRWVVSRHELPNGIGEGTNRYDHRYEGAVSDLRGGGWLGFSRHVITELDRPVVHDYRYLSGRAHSTASGEQLFAFGGYVSRAETTVTFPSGIVRRILREFNYEARPSPEAPAGQTVFAIRLARQTENQSEEGPGISSAISLIVNRLSTFRYDDYFNETFRQVVDRLTGEPLVDEHIYERTVDYKPADKASWLVTLPLLITEKSIPRIGASKERRSKLTVNEVTGLLDVEEREPTGDATVKKTVTYGREEGQVTSVTVSSPAGSPRTTTIIRDGTGIFPQAVINPALHTTRLTYHPGLGVLAAITDENNQTTIHKYDGFGRIKTIDRPDDADDTFSYLFYSLGAAERGLEIRSVSPGGMTRTSRLDRLDRQVTERTVVGSGVEAMASVAYERFGQPSAVYAAAVAGEAAEFRGIDYDPLGRPLSSYRAVGGQSQTAKYLGRRVEMSDEEAKTTVFVQDILGRTISSSAADSTASYVYGAFGSLEQVTIGGSQVTKTPHDAWGRRKEFESPDSGKTVFTYSGFDDLLKTVDGNGTTIQYVPDDLGRIREKRDGGNQVLAELFWDSSRNGFGQLGSTSTREGVTTRHTFDSFARPLEDAVQVSPTSSPRKTTRLYDQYGRLRDLVYPDVQARQLVVRHAYDSITGELQSVSRLGNATPLWSASERDGQRRIRTESFASGAVTSTTIDSRGFTTSIFTTSPQLGAELQNLEFGYFENGTLMLRKDLNTGTEEVFGYDDANRLATWEHGWGTGRLARYAYDNAGNLTGRTSEGGLELDNVSYRLTGGTSGGPNAVKWSSFGGDYTYYANGAQKSGGGRTLIEYTEFNLPKRVVQGGATSTFLYDAVQSRASKTSNGETTTYLGGLYEMRQPSGGATSHVFHLFGERPIVDVVWTETGGPFPPSEETLYLHQDPLGSTDAISRPDGTVKEWRKYDPFGNRVDRATLLSGPPSLTAETRQTFTGHEEDVGLDVVNMRGRIYDPRLSRFISPDPVVAAPELPISWNPYAYVLNQPTTLVDPTGFAPDVITLPPLDIVGRVPPDPTPTPKPPGGGGDGKAPTADDSGVRGEAPSASLFGNTTGPRAPSASVGSDNQGGNTGEPSRGDRVWDYLTEHHTGSDQINDILYDATWVPPPSTAPEFALAMVGVLLRVRPMVPAYAGVGSGLTGRAIPNAFAMAGPKPPTPPLPPGVRTTGGFGSKIMKWGSGNADARARISTITKDELVRGGVTKEIAVAWRDFYATIARSFPNNPSAPGRVDLMERVIRLLSE